MFAPKEHEKSAPAADQEAKEVKEVRIVEPSSSPPSEENNLRTTENLGSGETDRTGSCRDTLCSLSFFSQGRCCSKCA